MFSRKQDYCVADICMKSKIDGHSDWHSKFVFVISFADALKGMPVQKLMYTPYDM